MWRMIEHISRAIVLVFWLYVLWRLRVYRRGRYATTLIASVLLMIVGLILGVLSATELVVVSMQLSNTLVLISTVGLSLAGLYMLRHWEESEKDDCND